MFNIRSRNLFIVLFFLISLTLTYGCSYFSKPDEETMKSIIVKINLYGRTPKVDWKEFNMTKEFHKKVGGKNYYCIEVNYIFYHPDFRQDIVLNKMPYSFVKNGNSWNGRNGWPD